MNRINLTDGELAALAARIQRNYDYDAKSGRLISSRYGRTIRGKKRDKKGYLCVLCRLDKRQVFVLLHHAVWAICKGCWPEQQIDHINGNKGDNRIENLREVSGSENKRNTLYPWKPNKDTGLPGVYKKKGGYRIDVTSNQYFFRDKYEAFSHLTLLGRRYKEN